MRAGLNLGTIPVAQGSVIWSVLDRRDGSLLLGTGNEGKVLEARGAKITVLAETKSLVVTSLAEAWGGIVVLGTLPDGKVMKLDRGKLVDLATLKGAEHVWQVAYDPKTRSVFAATGPEGKLWRIGAGGEAQVYFDAEEQHLMSVAVAPTARCTRAERQGQALQITVRSRQLLLLRSHGSARVTGPQGECSRSQINQGGPLRAARRAQSGNHRRTAQPAQPPAKVSGQGTRSRFLPRARPISFWTKRGALREPGSGR